MSWCWTARGFLPVLILVAIAFQLGKLNGIHLCGQQPLQPPFELGLQAPTDDQPHRARSDYSTSALPPEVCERLHDEGLHRRHEGTPELERLDRQYALDAEVLRTGLVRGELREELLRKVANSDPVTVLTLGGSFTRGHGCGETTEQDELYCAWPARLERWWESHFAPGHWIHGAEHGAGSVATLQRIGAVVHALANKPDLVIVDFLVNDNFFPDDDVSTAGYESLIRALLELLPKAQIFLFEAGCHRCLSSEKVLRHQREVALHYSLPVIDYAAMVRAHNIVNGSAVLWPVDDPPIDEKTTYVRLNEPWPNFSPMVNTTKQTCCPNNHPPWPIHQYISDAIAFGLVQMLSTAGCKNGQPFHTQQELDKYPSCTKPLTWHDSLAGGKNVALYGTPNSSEWRLYEDKPGRPGWITTEVGSTITFPIRFGAQPTLAVTYLRSYAHVGIAKISISSHHGVSSMVQLQGGWQKNNSLPDTKVFIARPDGLDGNLLGDVLKSDGWQYWPTPEWLDGDNNKPRHYNVSITLLRGEKFKITQIISC